MAWLRIDDGYDSHPKILALGSDQRRWTWTRILVYTCRYRSPEIPANVTELVPRATPAFLRECVELGLIDVTDEDTYEVHDWDTYNGSDPAIQVRERVRKHRAKRYNGVTDTVTEALPERNSRAGTRARPVPSPTPDIQEAHHQHDAREPDDEDDLRLRLETHQLQGPARTAAEQLLTHDPARLEACITAAASRGTNAAAYLATLILNGSHPQTPAADEPEQSTLAPGAYGATRSAKPRKLLHECQHPNCGSTFKTQARLDEHVSDCHTQLERAPLPPEIAALMQHAQPTDIALAGRSSEPPAPPSAPGDTT